MKKIVYVDMDNVLVDFRAAPELESAHKRIENISFVFLCRSKVEMSGFPQYRNFGSPSG